MVGGAAGRRTGALLLWKTRLATDGVRLWSGYQRESYSRVLRDVPKRDKSSSLRKDLRAHDEDDALFAIGRDIRSKLLQQGEPGDSRSPCPSVERALRFGDLP